MLGNSFRWWSEVAATRGPTREKLLRSPGESLRRNLEQLNEYLIYSVALFLLAPMAFALQTPDLTSLWPLAFLVGLMVLCSVPGIYVVRLYRSYALSLRAERAVGEELNQLMLDRCHVFHDYPAGPGWNINHVVVAPSGVYAIETTVGQRGRAPGANKLPEAVFDGATVRFGRFQTAEPIQQAQRSAAKLRLELSHVLGVPVGVKAISSLPGWRVRRRASSDVLVLNPKEIWQAIVTLAAPELSPDQIQKLAYHIQQKCRDVEI